MRPDTREIAPLKRDYDLFLGWGKYFPNPDEILQRRGSGLGIKLYDQVARDPHAYAVLQTRRRAVAGLDWEVTPASDDARDVEIADAIGQILEAANFREANLGLLDAQLKGYSVVEVLYGRRPDGRIGIERFAPRGQHRFVFDPDGNPRLLTMENMIEGIDLPPRKFIVGSWGASDGNPYGNALGATRYWPVWFKKNLVKFWLIFAEKMGSPTVIGKYPPGASPDQQQALLDAIQAIQQETGIKVPDTMTVELLEAERKATGDFYGACAAFFNAEISKLVLGQTLTTEIGDKGSYAASQTHGDVRQDILEDDAAWVEEVHGRQTIPWLCDLNFGPQPNGYPHLNIRSEPPADLNAEVERDSKLFKDLGLPVSRSYLYAKYSIPEPAAGEELLIVPKEEPPPEPDPGQLDARGVKFSEAEKKTPNSGSSSRRRRRLTG
jgi:phage gp29-like protein